jgi:hypothetical protein
MSASQVTRIRGMSYWHPAFTTLLQKHKKVLVYLITHTQKKKGEEKVYL